MNSIEILWGGYISNNASTTRESQPDMLREIVLMPSASEDAIIDLGLMSRLYRGTLQPR